MADEQKDNSKYALIAVLVVLVILLMLNTDVMDSCRGLLGKSHTSCGCAGECMCGDKHSDSEKLASSSVREAFSGSGPDGEAVRSRPYEYNKDTMGITESQEGYSLAAPGEMDHTEYMRTVGIDRSVVENHRTWYEDPNIKPYWGANFNARSQVEQAYPVTPWGLRRRPTRVPIGVSARQVPDLDERDYAHDNQLKWAGNFSNTIPDLFSEVCQGNCKGLCKCTKDPSYKPRA